MLYVSLFSLLIATTSALQDGTLLKIPLRSRSSFTLDNGGIDEKTLFSAINATLEKYHASFVLPPFKELRLSAAIPKRGQYNQALTDDADLGYAAPVTVGSIHPQNFTLDFDTGKLLLLKSPP